jgi:hypothetical protein
MDGWTDGRTDGRTDGWMDGWMDTSPTFNSSNVKLKMVVYLIKH